MARNITLSLPDELVRKVKVLAAERDTSISALVASLLTRELEQGSDYNGQWAAEETLMRRGVLEVGRITWSRDQVHDR